MRAAENGIIGFELPKYRQAHLIVCLYWLCYRFSCRLEVFQNVFVCAAAQSPDSVARLGGFSPIMKRVSNNIRYFRHCVRWECEQTPTIRFSTCNLSPVPSEYVHIYIPIDQRVSIFGMRFIRLNNGTYESGKNMIRHSNNSLRFQENLVEFNWLIEFQRASQIRAKNRAFSSHFK